MTNLPTTSSRRNAIVEWVITVNLQDTTSLIVRLCIKYQVQGRNIRRRKRFEVYPTNFPLLIEWLAANGLSRATVRQLLAGLSKFAEKLGMAGFPKVSAKPTFWELIAEIASGTLI